jgi:signal transduction histidine kinase
MKLNFVAIASHELRTPATAVYGIATTLRSRRDSLPPEQIEVLEETLWSQSDRLRRLIEQLLDLSRLDAHAVQIEPQMVDVERLLQEVVDSVAGEGNDVRVETDSALVTEADPLVLDRIISNLVANALKYGEPPVVVSAVQSDRHLRIVVQDAGEGVPHDLVPRLFDRFQRGEAAGGSGLGLAIAKTYAVAHGGDLLYDDVGGARFEFVLPNA